ncbi:MAG: permease [Gemmataceae bacterium]|nr:permease [Gemmataceae bacterium]MDW8264731.1 permease [Gemmataceae bacterium]
MESSVRDFIVSFLSILYEALPFIVLGSVIAGILEEMVPQQLIARFLPRNRAFAILASGLLGLIFPMCECGIIPVMRRLLRKGLPLSCCVAYILAGPIINVVVLSSTYVAFAPHDGGLWIVALRMIVGYLVAMGAAAVVERQYRRHGPDLLSPLARADVSHLPSPQLENNETNNDRVGRKPWLRRVGNISETALHDFVDITVFLILGALLAALVRLHWSNQQVAELSQAYPGLAIGVMMLMAVLLCLCSEADAFVAASFTTLAPAPKLAFLVLGPMLDLKLYMMYTRVFAPRLIWTIIPTVVLQVLFWATLVHWMFELLGPALPGMGN